MEPVVNPYPIPEGFDDEDEPESPRVPPPAADDVAGPRDVPTVGAVLPRDVAPSAAGRPWELPDRRDRATPRVVGAIVAIVIVLLLGGLAHGDGTPPAHVAPTSPPAAGGGLSGLLGGLGG